jgi:hypothetical protein
MHLIRYPILVKAEKDVTAHIHPSNTATPRSESKSYLRNTRTLPPLSPLIILWLTQTQKHGWTSAERHLRPGSSCYHTSDVGIVSYLTSPPTRGLAHCRTGEPSDASEIGHVVIKD